MNATRFMEDACQFGKIYCTSRLEQPHTIVDQPHLHNRRIWSLLGINHAAIDTTLYLSCQLSFSGESSLFARHPLVAAQLYHSARMQSCHSPIRNNLNARRMRSAPIIPSSFCLCDMDSDAFNNDPQRNEECEVELFATTKQNYQRHRW